MCQMTVVKSSPAYAKALSLLPKITIPIETLRPWITRARPTFEARVRFSQQLPGQVPLTEMCC
jgi:hypothetical protein